MPYVPPPQRPFLSIWMAPKLHQWRFTIRLAHLLPDRRIRRPCPPPPQPRWLEKAAAPPPRGSRPPPPPIPATFSGVPL